jgi:hypothetical protein
MTGAAVLLGNVDYRRHMTTEGDQFQKGLQAAGWIVAGKGFDDLVDVPTILERYRPDRIVVHDPRDWDPGSPIAFRKDLGFTRVAAIANARAYRAVVVKDAASSILYQKGFYRLIQADAAIVYYSPRSIRRNAEWLKDVPLIRTYHSVDADDLALVGLNADRRAVVVSGALSMAYPLRQRVVRDARVLGVDVLWHPGYGNRGARTPVYCRQLAGYKVAIATASMYGFALRKIIEAVAVGCTVITDLPAYDVLPAIDGALVRVAPTINPPELAAVIAQAVAEWDPLEREEWARAARGFYDYRALGVRLDAALATMADFQREGWPAAWAEPCT